MNGAQHVHGVTSIASSCLFHLFIACSLHVHCTVALPTDVTVIAVSVVVVGIAFVIITVAIVTAVVVYCKRQSNYRYNHAHHHPVHVQSVVLLKYSSCNVCDLVYTVVVYSSVLCSLLAVQTQPSPPQATSV